jgi:hypothetical protein
VGQQEVHEYEALRGYPGGYLDCWLILFCQSLLTILRIILDTTLRAELGPIPFLKKVA